MFKYSLEIVLFICGAVTMILELVGSRLLAPHIGNSIEVWTGLIGIILASLSLGYWLGGLLADKNKPLELLTKIILASAFFIGISLLFKDDLFNWLDHSKIDLRLKTIIAASALFGLPSIFLGAVSPLAAKIRLIELNASGATVGALYAISTLGSIVGTFLAGFFLIPLIGSTKILGLLMILLLFCSIIAIPRLKSALFLLIYLVFIPYALANEPNGKAVDTEYNHVIINETLTLDKRPIRTLQTEAFGIQSAMFLDNDDDLVLNYTKYFRLAGLYNGSINKALMIGGGAFSFPKEFLRTHPSSTMDVIEIDPGLTEIAKKYFNFPDENRMKVFHQDGRVYLNENRTKYDAIYIDAFSTSIAIPFHLTTIETAERIHGSLTENGVALLNIISALEGKDSKFFKAEYATYRSIFPQVLVFAASENTDGSKEQNIILVALKSDHSRDLKNTDAKYKALLAKQWTKKIRPAPVLTDEYAPVESYISKLIR